MTSRLTRTGAVAALALATTPASAAETIAYGYDARGRLVRVERTLGAAAPVVTSYGFDKADNRLSKSVGSGTVSPPTFSIGDAAPVAEGQYLLFTLTRSGDISVAASVHAATADGTAVSPQDYGWASSGYTFAPGQTSLTLSVAAFADGVPEPAEYMYLRLSNPSSGAIIADAEAIGTITGP